MVQKPNYILITAARNEGAYIEEPIESVVAQTVLPKRWVIVSDGSTDRTDEIIKRYEAKYDFLKYMRIDSQESRNFGSKIYAFYEGYKQMSHVEYDFIGNLDADVSFGSNYYEQILTRFQENPKLGIAGGTIFDIDKYGRGFHKQFSNLNTVAGAIQMFRNECYKNIGGYIPLSKGGVDAIAGVMARMHGWEVKSFTDLSVFHHRTMGTEKGCIFSARFRQGIMEYSHGNHPLFELAKCLLRIQEKPYLIGSCFRISGYIWAYFRKVQRAVPNDVVSFIRREQIDRLYGTLSGKKIK